MSLLKQTGQTNPLALLNHLQTLEYKLDQYRAANNRRIIPLKRQLLGQFNKPTIGEGFRDERIEAFLDIAYPDWEIGLALHYKPSGNVGLHRDAGGYGKTAMSVSTTDFIFLIGDERHQCKAGAIYQFPSKIPHGTEPVHIDRYCLIAWQINWSNVLS